MRKRPDGVLYSYNIVITLKGAGMVLAPFLGYEK